MVKQGVAQEIESETGSREPVKASSSDLLSTIVKECRSGFLAAGLFSGLINVLMLAGAFYMMQVYDRVLPSGSLPTLVALSVLLVVLLATQAVLDLLRSRLMFRLGSYLVLRLAPHVFAQHVAPVKRTENTDHQPLRDVENLRSFLSGNGPSALFDLPWIPVYVALIFMLHPLLGIVSVAGALLLVTLALVAERLGRMPNADAAKAARSASGLAQAGRRNAEILQAMTMIEPLTERWQRASQTQLSAQQRSNDITTGISAFTRALRMLLQSAILGTGAFLVVNEQATGGVMLASSIIFGRALAPVDQAIANWRGLGLAHESWRRLKDSLAHEGANADPLALPAPRRRLSVEKLSASPPGSARITLSGVSFDLLAGEGLGIVGPSASGKSSLARIITGVWSPREGRVSLDGAALDQWGKALGRHVGYMPQNVQLFAGTIAENICRFDPLGKPEDIVAAAEQAGVHNMIVSLPEGYNTLLGDDGQGLSNGQRQRIALAMALYGNPFLVVLDEPNSNLDVEGEDALNAAIGAIRGRGAVVIVITHRAGTLAHVDKVMMLKNGEIAAFGTRDAIVEKMRASTAAQSGLRVVTRPGEGAR